MNTQHEKLNQLTRLINQSSKQLKQLIKAKLPLKEKALNLSLEIDGLNRLLEDPTTCDFTYSEAITELSELKESEASVIKQISEINKKINSITFALRIEV